MAAEKQEKYRRVVEDVLSQYVPIRYADGDIHNEAIFDRDRNNYTVLSLGWQQKRRVHHALLHVDIVQDKVWIQQDGTEEGIACDLEAAGIPKQDIVLGFHPPDVRPVYRLWRWITAFGKENALRRAE